MFKKLQDGWIMITSGLAAVLAVVGSAWGVFQYEQTKAEERTQNSEEIEIVGNAVQQLKASSDMTRWLYLRKLRKEIGLGANQHREYCYLGAQLFKSFDCPVYDGRRPRGD